MATYYVDSNASGAADGTSWTDAYANLHTAITARGGGNTYWLAHNHDGTYTSTTTYPSNASVEIISVNSSNDQYQVGAIERISSGTGTLNLACAARSQLSIYGVTFRSPSGTIRVNPLNESTNYVVEDCTFELTGTAAGDIDLYAVDHGWNAYFKNCTFQTQNSINSTFRMGVNTEIEFDGCTFKTLYSGSTLPHYIQVPSGNCNEQFTFRNCDFSNLNGKISGGLIDATTQTAASYAYKFINCKMHAWPVTWWDGTNTTIHEEIEAISCGTDDEYYNYYRQDMFGEVETNTTTYLNATYDGTNGFSIELNPNGHSSVVRPLSFKLYENPDMDLTTATTVTVNLTTDYTLTDTDFWVEVRYTDTTNQTLLKNVDSRNSDPLAAGTTLTTNTEAWTSAKTNKYQAAATVTAQTGVTNGTIEVWVWYENTDDYYVYVDPEVEIT